MDQQLLSHFESFKKPQTIKKNLLLKSLNIHLPIQLFYHQKVCVRKVLDYMQQYVPIIINGEYFEIKRSKCLISTKSGCGKTFIILSLVNFMVDWFSFSTVLNDNLVKVFRSTLIFMKRNWAEDFDGQDPKLFHLFPPKFIDICSNKENKWIKFGNINKLIICVYIPGELMRQWANAINSYFGREFFEFNVQIVKNKNDLNHVKSLIDDDKQEFLFILAKDTFIIPDCTFVFYDEFDEIWDMVFQKNEPLMTFGFLIQDQNPNLIPLSCSKLLDKFFTNILKDNTVLRQLDTNKIFLTETFDIPNAIEYFIYHKRMNIGWNGPAPFEKATFILTDHLNQQKYKQYIKKALSETLNYLTDIASVAYTSHQFTLTTTNAQTSEIEQHTSSFYDLFRKVKRKSNIEDLISSNEIYQSRLPLNSTFSLKNLIEEIFLINMSSNHWKVIGDFVDNQKRKIKTKLERYEALNNECVVCFENKINFKHTITDCCQVLLCFRCLQNIQLTNNTERQQRLMPLQNIINCPICRQSIISNFISYPANEFKFFNDLLMTKNQIPPDECIESLNNCFYKMLDFFIMKKGKHAVVYELVKNKTELLKINISFSEYEHKILFVDNSECTTNFEKKMIEFHESASLNVIIFPYSFLSYGFNLHFVDSVAFLNKIKDDSPVISKFKRFPRNNSLIIYRFQKDPRFY